MLCAEAWSAAQGRQHDCRLRGGYRQGGRLAYLRRQDAAICLDRSLLASGDDLGVGNRQARVSPRLAGREVDHRGSTRDVGEDGLALKLLAGFGDLHRSRRDACPEGYLGGLQLLVTDQRRVVLTVELIEGSALGLDLPGQLFGLNLQGGLPLGGRWRRVRARRGQSRTRRHYEGERNARHCCDGLPVQPERMRVSIAHEMRAASRSRLAAIPTLATQTTPATGGKSLLPLRSVDRPASWPPRRR